MLNKSPFFTLVSCYFPASIRSPTIPPSPFHTPVNAPTFTLTPIFTITQPSHIYTHTHTPLTHVVDTFSSL